MARPTALAPLGAVFRSIGSTLEGIGAGIADTSSREKRVLPSRTGRPDCCLGGGECPESRVAARDPAEDIAARGSGVVMGWALVIHRGHAAARAAWLPSCRLAGCVSTVSSAQKLTAGCMWRLLWRTVSRHREVMGLPNMAPAISDNCFVAPSANIVGNVKVCLVVSLASDRERGHAA
jgi:hypothetical protein